MPSSRVKVLEFNQKIHEQPKHVVTKSVAAAMIQDCNATRCNTSLIRLTTSKCFNFVKFCAKRRIEGKAVIPLVCPVPGYEDGTGHGFLPYSPGHDSSSYSRKNFEELWSSLAMIPAWMREKEDKLAEESWKRREGLRIEEV